MPRSNSISVRRSIGLWRGPTTCDVFTATGNCRFIAKLPAASSVPRFTVRRTGRIRSGWQWNGCIRRTIRCVPIAHRKRWKRFSGNRRPANPSVLTSITSRVNQRRSESNLNAEEIARSASNTGNVKFPGFLTEEKPAFRAWNKLLAAWDSEFAHWPMSALRLPSSLLSARNRRYLHANGMAVPLFEAHGLAAQIRAAAEKAAPVEFIAKLIAHVPFAIAPETEELSHAFLDSLKAAEVVAEPTGRRREAPIPICGADGRATRRSRLSPHRSFSAAALRSRSSVWKSQTPRCDAGFASPVVAAVTRLAVAPVTRMQPLAMTNAPRALAARAGAAGDAKAGELRGYAQPMELKAATGAPSMKFALTAAAPEMQLAPGNGYAVLNGTGAPPAKWNAASDPSARALELQSETSRPFAAAPVAILGIGLAAAPGCRYDVHSQPGPIQQAGAAQRSGVGNEISIVPAPVKQLATQSLALGLGIAGPCQYPVQSAAGNTLPAGSAEALAAAQRSPNRGCAGWPGQKTAESGDGGDSAFGLCGDTVRAIRATA